MCDTVFNKFRAAAQVLQRSRDMMIEAMAEDVLDQADDLTENGFLLNEFLETQGTRLHFLTLVLSQLEQSAEAFDEMAASQPPPRPAPKPAASQATTPRKRKPRAKKITQNAPAEGTIEDF